MDRKYESVIEEEVHKIVLFLEEGQRLNYLKIDSKIKNFIGPGNSLRISVVLFICFGNAF